ncbi:MAG TPA: hypothetical protein VLV83_15110 [Acidobacteriota bacterium]|nr:hypothetical protein [Acidobacteriota bacterium]
MFKKEQRQSSLNPMLVIPAAALLVVILGLAVYFLTPGPPPPPGEVEGMIRQGDAEFERFSQSIRLENSSISMTANFSGGETALFKAALLNLTTHTVDAVEVELQFFNYEDRVGEVTRMVLHPHDDEAMPPQHERGVSIALDEEHFPEGWHRQHAEMHLHGFRFARQPEPVQ